MAILLIWGASIMRTIAGLIEGSFYVNVKLEHEWKKILIENEVDMVLLHLSNIALPGKITKFSGRFHHHARTTKDSKDYVDEIKRIVNIILSLKEVQIKVLPNFPRINHCCNLKNNFMPDFIFKLEKRLINALPRSILVIKLENFIAKLIYDNPQESLLNILNLTPNEASYKRIRKRLNNFTIASIFRTCILSADGVHPTDLGYNYIVRTVILIL